MKNTTQNNNTSVENHSQVERSRQKRQKTKHPYPSDKSQWAYMMQAIEPSDLAINAAFPGYHPLWLQHSQRLNISGEQFKNFRQHLIQITQQQCAAYLRVKLSQLRKWEQGKEPVPFMAFELLRLIFESLSFKISHPEWEGWFIDGNGKLVSPDRGRLSFTPSELSFIRETHNHKAILEMENKALRDEVEELTQQLEGINTAIQHDGLIDELHQMKAQLEAMLGKLSTANVYPFPQPKNRQERKVANA